MADAGRTGRTGSEQADASFDILGGETNQLRKDVADLKQKVAKTGTPTTVSAPTPAVPFIIGQVADPASTGELDTFRSLIPAGSEKLIIRTRRIDEPNQKIKEWEFDVEDSEAAAGQIEREFGPLDNDGQYGLVSMLVRGSTIRKARNPDPPNDAANLTTWTTLGFFKTHTSRPDVGLILENKLDDVTKRFDCFIAVRCYCPINGDVNTYTGGTVSINSTTTLTGTANFNTRIPPVVPGMLVIVSGQTRQVVSVAGGAGLTLVVDRAFVGAQAGLAMQYGVPHTWLSSLTKMVIAKFQYADGTAHLDDQRHEITDDEEGQNFVDWRIKGLLCPRRVSWVSNILVGGINGRKRITPISPQIFISGGFTDATAGLPELTSVGYQYDSTDPFNPKQRLVRVRMTQPANCIALERAELYIRKTSTGGANVTSTVNVVGVGTLFLEEFSIGSGIEISGQLREVTAVADNTHLTVNTAFAAASGAITASKLVDKKQLDSKHYHPTGGGVVQIDWGEKHVKKLVSHTFRTIIYAMNTQSRTLDDAFTPAAGGPIDGDTAAPGFANPPRLMYKRGKLVADLDLLGATNVATVRDRYYALIYNGGAINLDLSDPLRKTAAAVFAFSQVNSPHFSHPQDLEQMVKIFGTGASVYVQFQAQNDVGLFTSGNSNAIVLSGQADVTTLYNPNNRVRNGHFTAQDGTNAKRWLDYDPRSGSTTPLAVTGKVRFDLDAHRGKWRDCPTQDNQRFLIQKLGKSFFPSEFYSLSWNMYSNLTPTLDELVLGLFTKKTLSNNISGTASTNTVSGTGFLTDLVKVGSIIGENSVGQWRTVTGVTSTSLTVDRVWGSSFGPTPGFALIPQASRLSQTNVALTTADLFTKGVLQLDSPSTFDATLDIYFCVILRDIVDTTTFPFIDAICLNAGQESAGYQLSVESFETNFAGASEDFDTPPTAGSSSGGSQLRGAGSGDPGEVVSIIPY